MTKAKKKDQRTFKEKRAAGEKRYKEAMKKLKNFRYPEQFVDQENANWLVTHPEVDIDFFKSILSASSNENNQLTYEELYAAQIITLEMLKKYTIKKKRKKKFGPERKK